MERLVSYTMDGVGYSKVFEAGSEEEALAMCADNLRENYPVSVFDITGVETTDEGVVEKVEKKKKKVKEV
jgi:hypothetical protein